MQKNVEKNMANDIKALVFDMDGVLLDTESMSDKTWAMAAKDFNVTVTEEDLNKCRGSNKSDIIMILKGIYGNEFDAENFLCATGKYFHELEFSSGIPLMHYAKEILEYLKPKYHLALASSTSGPTVERQLRNAGLIDFFEKRITGDMVLHSKPDPEIYTMACSSINVAPANCLAIEDSPNGIRSANAAGMNVIMVPDRIKPTAELEELCWKILPSLEDLKTVL